MGSVANNYAHKFDDFICIRLSHFFSILKLLENLDRKFVEFVDGNRLVIPKGVVTSRNGLVQCANCCFKTNLYPIRSLVPRCAVIREFRVPRL